MKDCRQHACGADAKHAKIAKAHKDVSPRSSQQSAPPCGICANAFGTRYEKYKQTGIPWLPEVPEGWDVRLNQFMFKENVRTPLPEDIPLSLSQVDGLIPTVDMKEKSLKTSSYDGWKRVLQDDLVLNRFKAHLGVLFASKFVGMVSFHYGVYEAIAKLVPKYYEYLYHTPVYRFMYSVASKGMTVGLQNLSNTAFYNTRSPFPDYVTQRAIVAYLDDKCGKIDELVAAKEKEVELLKELKQTVIADAVTRGVEDGRVEGERCREKSLSTSTSLHGKNKRRLVPSGIPWLPQIPEGWEVKRLGAYFTDDVVANKDFRYNRAFKFNYGRLIPKNEIGEPEEYRDVYVKYSVLKEGDIVLNGLNLNYDFISQRVAESPSDGIITSAYVVCRPRAGVFSRYFTYLFKAMDFRKMFHGMGTGIRLTLSYSELKKQMLPVPPLDEQREIVAYIEEKTAKIDQAVAGLTQQVAAQKEYKQRLIADVVTGQMRVA